MQGGAVLREQLVTLHLQCIERMGFCNLMKSVTSMAALMLVGGYMGLILLAMTVLMKVWQTQCSTSYSVVSALLNYLPLKYL